MKHTLGLIVLLFVVGCQFDPYSHTFTTTKPSLEDIEGEYVLTRISMESDAPGIRVKIQELNSPPIVRLYADGRFTANNFHFFSETRQGFEYRFEDFRAIETTREMAVVGVIGDGSGNTKDHQGLRLAELPLHLSFLGFTGEYIDGLIFVFGDPDSGNEIIFQKSNTGPSAVSDPVTYGQLKV